MNFIIHLLSVFRQSMPEFLQWNSALRHVLAYWSALSLGPPTPEAQPPAAQTCNEDVLDEIFSYLLEPSLASAACVCRNWLPTARVRLYRGIYVDNVLRPSEKLAQTLFTQPPIRSLVRQPVLRYADMGRRIPALFDWIALLPEHSFLSVEIEIVKVSSKKPLTTLGTLLNLPAIRTTPRLIIHCMTYVTPKRLSEILGMPYLESLSINIPERTAVYLKSITGFPKLRRLSVRMEIYLPLICKLLHGLPSPLEHLDIRSRNLTAVDINALCRVLERHAPHLRHLSFLGQPFSTLCFMDDFVSSFTSLEFLLCADHLYSPAIFPRLPPTLTSLALCTPWSDPLPADKYAAAIQKHRSRLPRLREVIIVNGQPSPLQCDPLLAVCEVESIAFRGPSLGSVERSLLR